ncbi:hypothetical protein CP500_022525, partial [Tychonema bourrellyi FEM_GT703]
SRASEIHHPISPSPRLPITPSTENETALPHEEGERKEVIPAQGWVMNSQGNVTLVGYNSGYTASGRNPRQNPVCLPR